MVCAVPKDAINHNRVAVPAIIGKLPAHGDFIARGVDHAFREKLDRWMSQWIELAQAELGDEFEGTYRGAAPWIFEGEYCHAVLMPSADSVGRLFPVFAITEAQSRCQLIYDALVDALSGALTGDDLFANIAAIEPEPAASNDNSSGWFLPEGAEITLPSPDLAEGWAEVAESMT